MLALKHQFKDEATVMHALKSAVLLIVSAVSLSACFHGPGESAAVRTQHQYAGQQTRAIKSLSGDDIAELRRGGGWGLAKAAELNGLPGPAHLLELKSELKLSEIQISQIEELHQQMRADALRHGEKLIAQEQALDIEFQRRSVDRASLKKALAEIAQTRAALRFVHLSAHLSTAAILTEAQIENYNELRGYGSADVCAKVPAGHDAALWRRHNGCDGAG